MGKIAVTERVTGHTELIGLIAYPIRHSMSPTMHNEAFKKLGLDYVYVCFEVERVELVYRWNDEMNGKDVGEDRNPTYPSWKFTLYNPNDGIYRDAFVDALSGEVQIY